MVDKVVLFFSLLLFTACENQAPEHQHVVLTGDTVKIPLSIVSDGGVHFFTYKYSGKNVNFFVRTDGDGQLHTHFDACYSCFKYKEGYVHEGTRVICIACRIGYDLKDAIWDYVGACAPITLKNHIMETDLVIRQRNLEKGSKFF